MADDFRYVLRRTGSGCVEVDDTLRTDSTYVGLKNVDAMGLTRSDLEDLFEEIERILKDP